MSRTTTLVYSPQCTNCARFIDALRRTPAASSVAMVDVAQLTPQQLSSVTAVPALITAEGQTLYGTKAFEWLKQYEADVQLESFNGNGTLPFSDIGSMGYATYATDFSAFEPVD